MSMYYRYGEAAALRDLGLEKVAFDIPVPGVRPQPAMKGVPRTMDVFNAFRARQAAKAAAPAAAAAGAPKAPGLLQRAMTGLGNTKIPVKALAGIGAVAGGAYLANKAMSDPHVEVHPTLPMRTMYS